MHTYLWLLHAWILLSIPIPTRWRERYQQDFLSCFLISLTWTFFALQFAGTDTWLANPALPDDILRESVPGNIRRAEHFVSFLKRLVQYLKGRLQTEQVESEGPVSFLNSLQSQAGIDQKTLKFCYDRLHSLLLTLEVTDTDEFMHIQCVCDFATLVGTYTRGFSIIIEPYDERMPNVPDPVLQACIDPYSLVPLCLHFTTRICKLIQNENTGCLVFRTSSSFHFRLFACDAYVKHLFTDFCFEAGVVSLITNLLKVTVIKNWLNVLVVSAQSFVGSSIHLWLEFRTCAGFVCEL